jgi:hypothetical protein
MFDILNHPTPHPSPHVSGFPVSLPWVIAALCFGWSVFMTVEMLTKEEAGLGGPSFCSSLPHGTCL